ncbi:glycerophosphodiester phosphodiesterase [Variovorax sp. PCZ-1]|uniref:glycerophosphodiester phosphodiesterase n=1 Tax=Variovorax sp. PCZ-1 TaxID=2835533 RepID=UPI001BCEC014|nr:glycerophosphodiester phosphodiesterase [Variovorax sp. PCZ-1]MBS7806375.1 glycerophosphodiester phosphodiesterase [Variovorax sp. PCZ-1]
MNTATAQTKAFDLQGHRGARGLLPENTLPAFEKAIELGVTTLELDVGVSKDGSIVISHDRALNPEITRDASGAYLSTPVLVNRLTLAELKTYDVGRINPDSAYAKRFPDQQPIDGTRMPALSTLFKRVEALGAKKMRFNIETKISPEKHNDTVSAAVFARKLLNLVREHGVVSRTTIQSFDWRTLQIIQELQKGHTKQVQTSCLTAQQPWGNLILGADKAPRWTGSVSAADHPDVPSMVKAAGCDIWSPYFADITPALVKKAQSLGLQVLPWTTNTEAEMNAVIDAGVDGLITDYPDRAQALIKQRGISLR